MASKGTPKKPPKAVDHEAPNFSHGVASASTTHFRPIEACRANVNCNKKENCTFWHPGDPVPQHGLVSNKQFDSDSSTYACKWDQHCHRYKSGNCKRWHSDQPIPAGIVYPSQPSSEQGSTDQADHSSHKNQHQRQTNEVNSKHHIEGHSKDHHEGHGISHQSKQSKPKDAKISLTNDIQYRQYIELIFQHAQSSVSIMGSHIVSHCPETKDMDLMRSIGIFAKTFHVPDDVVDMMHKIRINGNYVRHTSHSNVEIALDVPYTVGKELLRYQEYPPQKQKATSNRDDAPSSSSSSVSKGKSKNDSSPALQDTNKNQHHSPAKHDHQQHDTKRNQNQQQGHTRTDSSSDSKKQHPSSTQGHSRTDSSNDLKRNQKEQFQDNNNKKKNDNFSQEQDNTRKNQGKGNNQDSRKGNNSPSRNASSSQDVDSSAKRSKNSNIRIACSNKLNCAIKGCKYWHPMDEVPSVGVIVPSSGYDFTKPYTLKCRNFINCRNKKCRMWHSAGDIPAGGLWVNSASREVFLKSFNRKLRHSADSKSSTKSLQSSDKGDTRRCPLFDNCNKYGCLFKHSKLRIPDCKTGLECPDRNSTCSLRHPSEQKQTRIIMRDESSSSSDEEDDDDDESGSQTSEVSQDTSYYSIATIESDFLGTDSTMPPLQARREAQRKMQSYNIYADREEILGAIGEKYKLYFNSDCNLGDAIQLPQYLAEEFGSSGIVLSIQSSLSHADLIAQIIAREFEQVALLSDSTLVRRFSPSTPIPYSCQIVVLSSEEFVTYGVEKQLLSKASAAVVNEAHTRSLSMDITLAILARELSLNESSRSQNPLRVAICSSNHDDEKIHKFFGIDAPFMLSSIDSDVTYGVEKVSLLENFGSEETPGPNSSEPTTRASSSNLISAILSTLRLHLQNEANAPIGNSNCLVFVEGGEQAKRLKAAFLDEWASQKRGFRKKCQIHVETLDGASSPSEVQAVVDWSPTSTDDHLLVFTTSVAESLLAVAGVSLVIDTGMRTINRRGVISYTFIDSMTCQVRRRTLNSSSSNCTYVRLFHPLEEQPEPEISITDPRRAALLILRSELNAENLLTSPPDWASSVEWLLQNGCCAASEQGEKRISITNRGQVCARLNFEDLRWSLFLLYAAEANQLFTASAIAAICNYRGSYYVNRLTDQEKQQQKAIQAAWREQNTSDALIAENLYRTWISLSSLPEKRAIFIKANFILERAFYNIRQHQQTMEATVASLVMQGAPKVFLNTETAIGRALVNAFQEYIGELLLESDPSVGAYFPATQSLAQLAKDSCIYTVKNTKKQVSHFVALKWTADPRNPTIPTAGFCHPVQLDWILNSDMQGLVKSRLLRFELCSEHLNVHDTLYKAVRTQVLEEAKSSHASSPIIHLKHNPNTLTLFAYGPQAMKSYIEQKVKDTIDGQIHKLLSYEANENLGAGNASFRGGLVLHNFTKESNSMLRVSFVTPKDIKGESELIRWIRKLIRRPNASVEWVRFNPARSTTTPQKRSGDKPSSDTKKDSSKDTSAEFSHPQDSRVVSISSVAFSSAEDAAAFRYILCPRSFPLQPVPLSPQNASNQPTPSNQPIQYLLPANINDLQEAKLTLDARSYPYLLKLTMLGRSDKCLVSLMKLGVNPEQILKYSSTRCILSVSNVKLSDAQSVMPMFASHESEIASKARVIIANHATIPLVSTITIEVETTEEAKFCADLLQEFGLSGGYDPEAVKPLEVKYTLPTKPAMTKIDAVFSTTSEAERIISALRPLASFGEAIASTDVIIPAECPEIYESQLDKLQENASTAFPSVQFTLSGKKTKFNVQSDSPTKTARAASFLNIAIRPLNFSVSIPTWRLFYSSLESIGYTTRVPEATVKFDTAVDSLVNTVTIYGLQAAQAAAMSELGDLFGHFESHCKFLDISSIKQYFRTNGAGLIELEKQWNEWARPKHCHKFIDTHRGMIAIYTTEELINAWKVEKSGSRNENSQKKNNKRGNQQNAKQRQENPTFSLLTIDQVCDNVRAIIGGFSAVSQNDTLSCSFCASSSPQSRFQICGHSFCNSCLENHAKTQVPPISCPTCSQLIPIQNFKQLGSSFAEIACASVSNQLKLNPHIFQHNPALLTLAVCPSITCGALIDRRPKEQSYRSCPECSVDACLECGVISNPTHEGKTCIEFMQAMQSSSPIDDIFKRAETFIEGYVDHGHLGTVIERARNPFLEGQCLAWNRFAAAVQANGGDNMLKNSFFAWYATKPTTILHNLKQGFDPSHGRKGQVLGKGEYFGYSASVSDGYAGRSGILILTLILNVQAVKNIKNFCYIVQNDSTWKTSYCLPVMLVRFRSSIKTLSSILKLESRGVEVKQEGQEDE